MADTMSDARREVLRRHPGAVATWAELHEINRRGWVIRRHEDCWMVGWPWMLGSGATEAGAWDHALSLIRAGETATCG